MILWKNYATVQTQIILYCFNDTFLTLCDSLTNIKLATSLTHIIMLGCNLITQMGNIQMFVHLGKTYAW